jgi:hypothetical protein
MTNVSTGLAVVIVLLVIAAIGAWLAKSKGYRPAKQLVTVGEAIAQSLQPLGLQLSARHVIGFIIAAVSGMVVGRVLPYVWVLLDPILTLVFGPGVSPARDNTNYVAMTAITAFTSFYLAYRTFKKP